MRVGRIRSVIVKLTSRVREFRDIYGRGPLPGEMGPIIVRRILKHLHVLAFRLDYRLEDMLRIRLQGFVSRDPRDLEVILPEVDGYDSPTHFGVNLYEIEDQVWEMARMPEHDYCLDTDLVLIRMVALVRRLSRVLHGLDDDLDVVDLPGPRLVVLNICIADLAIYLLHVKANECIVFRGLLPY